jgi:hypothetical protein
MVAVSIYYSSSHIDAVLPSLSQLLNHLEKNTTRFIIAWPYPLINLLSWRGWLNQITIILVLSFPVLARSRTLVSDQISSLSLACLVGQ